ncbi:MAG: carbon-nitrogen hydrolase family protein [Solirubrobacteraceae bacterium]|nr:carbon-nitrogen hydrolase family protein [Patulibacter sp.]
MSDLRVALAQTSPVWFDPLATAQKAAALVADAAAGGAQVIAFPETFVSGYPLWPSRTGGAAFEDDAQKGAFSVYLDAAVLADGPEVAVIAEACALHDVFAFVGATERGSGTGHGTTFCSIIAIDPGDGVVGVHRKLVPTHDERMIWGRGDGAGLRTYEVGGVRIGALNCWENWMPQARHALYADGEDVHIGLWPGSVSLTSDITRFIAMEGRVWSLAVGGVLDYAGLPERFPLRDEVVAWPHESPFDGGSCVAAPGGGWVAEPTVGDVGLLFADLDLDAVRRERLSFDVAGHYARPDVFAVTVDRRRQSASTFVER